MDVMLSLTTNTALADGVAPDQRRIRAEFPYFGEPYPNSRPPVAGAERSETSKHIERRAMPGLSKRERVEGSVGPVSTSLRCRLS